MLISSLTKRQLFPSRISYYNYPSLVSQLKFNSNYHSPLLNKNQISIFNSINPINSIYAKTIAHTHTITKLNKFYISNMENTQTVNKTDRLVTQKELEDLTTLAKSIGINEKNLPDMEKKNIRALSFGGRVRIAALIASDAAKWIGSTITIGGWVRTIRVQGGGEFAFIEINDGSSIKGIQVVVNKTLSNFSEVTKEGIGSCFQIKGSIIKSPGNKQPVIKIYNNNTSLTFIINRSKCKLEMIQFTQLKF